MKQYSPLLFLLIALFSSCHPKKETLQQPVNKLPVCLQKKTEEYKKLEKKYRPAHITRYTYKEKPVYYIPARCCDVMSEVYSENCEIICHPEGGITGKGDGKCPDFLSERKDPVIVWEDETF